jgi:Leucine-rich repeat (LRR) protein
VQLIEDGSIPPNITSLVIRGDYEDEDWNRPYTVLTDISPLAELTNLQSLGLPNNHITDLTPLAGLTNLRTLYLQDNRIADLTPLAGLTNLRTLYLQNNRIITDITPLAGLTNLRVLWLSNNQITDLTPLAGLTDLQRLYLERNQITDISPLAGLTELQRLDLTQNRIADISPLENFFQRHFNVGLTNNRVTAEQIQELRNTIARNSENARRIAVIGNCPDCGEQKLWRRTRITQDGVTTTRRAAKFNRNGNLVEACGKTMVITDIAA